jgi:glycosidase
MADAGPPIPLIFSDGPSLKRSIARYADGAHDADIARAFATLLLTTRAATMLYYGQELGLTEANATIAFDEPKKGEPPAPTNVAAAEANFSSLLNWYRRLSALAHGNRTINSGSMTTLNHDDQNILVWVRRPKTPSPSTPAIVVLENLSAQPVTVSLKEDMQRLHLRGTFLRTVMRSDTGMGGMSLSKATLPPYGVFIGELRY